MKLTNDPALLEEMAALPTDVNVDSFILTQFSTEKDVPQERVKKKRSAAKGENVKAHQPKKGSGRKRTQAQRKEVSNNIERDAASNEEDPTLLEELSGKQSVLDGRKHKVFFMMSCGSIRP